MVTTNPLGVQRGGMVKLFLRTCLLTLAAISNGDLLGGLSALGTIGIDLLDDLHAKYLRGWILLTGQTTDRTKEKNLGQNVHYRVAAINPEFSKYFLKITQHS
jgi:hypothetical protein